MVGAIVAKWMSSLFVKLVRPGGIFGFIGSALGAIGSIFGLAEGYEGMVTKPTPFVAGEAGPEWVSVTPVSRSMQPIEGSAPAAAAGPGKTVTVNNTWNVYAWDSRDLEGFLRGKARPILNRMLGNGELEA